MFKIQWRKYFWNFSTKFGWIDNFYCENMPTWKALDCAPSIRQLVNHVIKRKKLYNMRSDKKYTKLPETTEIAQNIFLWPHWRSLRKILIIILSCHSLLQEYTTVCNPANAWKRVGNVYHGGSLLGRPPLDRILCYSS